MNLQKSEWDELNRLALRSATEAASLIQEKVGRPISVDQKAGGDTLASQVVTEVDLASQERILAVLAPSFSQFDLGLLTEESEDDSSRFSHDFFWCIDPLDGTLPFTEDRSGYSVSIALLSREGVPQLGVIADPRSGTVFQAQMGRGAFRNGNRMSLPSGNPASELTWLMDRSFRSLSYFPHLQREVEEFATSLNFQTVSIIDHGGAAMNACQVHENAPAFYFKFPKLSNGGGSIWDYAASACIFAELGMSPTDIHSSPLELNRRGSTFMNRGGVVYASSEHLAVFARSLFRRFG